jgi:hypothetical protein
MDITIKKRTPLELAALDFAAVLNQIEMLDGDLDQAVLSTFGELKLELADAVDRRIYFLQFLESQIEHVKKMAQAWTERRRILESLEDRIKESTKLVIERSEGAMKLKGNTGELSVQKSPVSMHLSFEPMKKSYEIVTDDLVSKHEIPAKYLQHVELLQLNKTAIREDLQAGIELSFAKLVRNTHIRIRI